MLDKRVEGPVWLFEAIPIAGNLNCRKAGMQERSGAGKEKCRKRGIQEKRDSRKEGSAKVGFMR